MNLRAFVLPRWGNRITGVLLVTGLLCQLVLTALLWQLVDLSVLLMEVWAELARKHLEIVLS